MFASPEVQADAWLVAEAPAAVALSDAHQGVFRPGLMPAIGAYAEKGRLALGLRLRLGVLRNGAAPGDNLADPGLGGLGTASLAVRVRHAGGWLEAAGGGGLTGRDVVPAVEVGVGWSFASGAVELGPSLRLARVISADAMASFGTADLLLVGLDVRFGRDRAPARTRIAPAPPALAPIAPIAAIAPIAVEPDHDQVVEREASCATLLDGCPITHDLTIVDDRIVLDEHVLFDFDRARVRTGGRSIIHAIAAMWEAHPEWTRVTIEGHADIRGAAQWNLELSQLRAERVRAIFLERGVAADRIDAKGYGPARPRDAGTTEDAHRQNRRVEFVIERGTP